jgi:hypothetical protein
MRRVLATSAQKRRCSQNSEWFMIAYDSHPEVGRDPDMIWNLIASAAPPPLIW